MYDSLGLNANPQSDNVANFSPLRLDTFSGKEPIVRIKYVMDGGADDFTPSDYKALGNNNEYIKTQYFKNYYAYDDGSAEGGYGLDYGSLPAGPAYSAMKFDILKDDTLRGILMFFNRSVADVSFKPFTLMIWRNISEPPANDMANDVILKKVELQSSLYADSINGFVNILLDTPIILSAGSLYLGWQQTSNYILNVGYDNNYKYLRGPGRNPNLYYNLNGYWEKVSSNITGTPMMRPLFGGKIYNPSSIRSKYAGVSRVMIFPNPSGNSSVLMLDSERDIQSVKVYDISGKVCLELAGDNIEELNIAALPSGFYQVLVMDDNKQSSIHKYIKN